MKRHFDFYPEGWNTIHKKSNVKNNKTPMHTSISRHKTHAKQTCSTRQGVRMANDARGFDRVRNHPWQLKKIKKKDLWGYCSGVFLTNYKACMYVTYQRFNNLTNYIMWIFDFFYVLRVTNNGPAYLCRVKIARCSHLATLSVQNAQKLDSNQEEKSKNRSNPKILFVVLCEICSGKRTQATDSWKSL